MYKYLASQIFIRIFFLIFQYLIVLTSRNFRFFFFSNLVLNIEALKFPRFRVLPEKFRKVSAPGRRGISNTKFQLRAFISFRDVNRK